MNKYFKIEGGNTLTGTVRINGAKNSSLPLMIATLLANEKFILEDIPRIQDVSVISSILERLGTKVYYQDENKTKLVIDHTDFEYKELKYEDVSKLRASYYFLGAMLGRYGKAKILLPGGCFLGPRPIDLHLKGFKMLGCEITQTQEGNFDVLEVNAIAGKLIGTKIFLDFPSVGATINLILAAAQAEGETIIENAAKEPEIIDVVMLLNKMGANIKGAGTEIIKIEGIREFKGCEHQVIPDRIEAGTYITYGSLLAEDLTVENIIPEHLEPLFAKLIESGVNLEIGADWVRIRRSFNKLQPINIKTGVHPSFPTDLQQIMATFLTQIEGQSTIVDIIYPERFRNCEYLNKMGANINIEIKNESGRAEITGSTDLVATEVIATDLRAGAGLIFAGLLAKGTTIVYDIEHILRGYDRIIEKLQTIGADISLITKEEV